jgi:GTP cyclohydrolase I
MNGETLRVVVPSRNGKAPKRRGEEPRRADRVRRTAGGGVDPARIEAGVREILRGLGEDVTRAGLVDTPARVARAYQELMQGMGEEAGDHLRRVFPQEHTGEDLVMLRDIQFTSLCEHHMLPFTGVAHVAYLPSHGRVTGLSKLARTVDVYARRLQMQERLTAQVADALVEHLDPRGVAVVVEAEHSCLRLRGARKEEARMVTTAVRGAMKEDRALRSEVFALMRVG